MTIRADRRPLSNAALGGGSRPRDARPLRVLYVTESGQLFGSEAYVLNLVRGFDRTRLIPVVIVGTPGELVDRLQVGGIQTIVIPHGPNAGKQTLWDVIAVNWRLWRLIQTECIDVVEANTTAALPFVVWAAKLAGKPLVVRIMMTNWLDLSVRWLLKFADVITYESLAVCASLTQKRRSDLLLRIPTSRMRLIRSTRILTDWNSQETGEAFRHELGVGAEVPLIGMVAALSPRKGQATLIRAMPKILEHYPEAKAVFVGAPYKQREQDFQYVESLKELARTLRIDHAVVFMGFRSDIPQILPALNVAILLSTREAAGSVLIEYMICRRPIVAAHTEGIPETVGEEGAAFLVPPDDFAQAAEAIVRILRDPALAARMGAIGRQRAEERFSASVVGQECERLYRELLYRQRPGLREPEGALPRRKHVGREVVT